MRSLTDLQAMAKQHGIEVVAHVNPATGLGVPLSREEIMDALRAKIGTFDPDLQIDPAKAQDLKHKIAWGADEPFKGLGDYLNDKWVLEPKLDGARMRVFLGTTANTMNTGRRSDVTFTYIERAANFPHLRDCVVPELAGTVIDCELMPPVSSLTTVTGVTTKGTLNSAMALLNVNPAASIATQEKYGRAIAMCFDVLVVKGESVTHLPFSQRRAMLEKILGCLSERCEQFQLITQLDATVENVQSCLDAGFEGAMLKRREAPYLPGKRMSDWQKVKRMSTGDFFIIGSVNGKGKNEGKVGSLRVAFAIDADEFPGYDAAEPTKVKDGVVYEVPGAQYCADVRGFDDAFMEELTDPETGYVKKEWVGKVIEIMGQGKTKNLRIRHPHFVCLRPDKMPLDCSPECSIDLFEEV